MQLRQRIWCNEKLVTVQLQSQLLQATWPLWIIDPLIFFPLEACLANLTEIRNFGNIRSPKSFQPVWSREFSQYARVIPCVTSEAFETRAFSESLKTTVETVQNVSSSSSGVDHSDDKNCASLLASVACVLVIIEFDVFGALAQIFRSMAEKGGEVTNIAPGQAPVLPRSFLQKQRFGVNVQAHQLKMVSDVQPSTNVL